MQTANLQLQTVEERKDNAREQSAIFPMKLALARWMSGAEPQLNHSYPPLRAAWLAKAQRDFQAWLDAGGFVHDDGEATDKLSGEHKPSWAV